MTWLILGCLIAVPFSVAFIYLMCVAVGARAFVIILGITFLVFFSAWCITKGVHEVGKVQ